MEKKFKEQVYKTSGISKSYMQIRESIDLDKYADVDCKIAQKPKRTLMPKLLIGCGALCCTALLTVGVVSIVKANSQTHVDNGYSLFYEYQSSFDVFKTRVEEYRQHDTHNLAPKPYNLFEITNNYGYQGSYVIEGICGCKYEQRDELHKDGICPSFDMHSPHYYFKDNLEKVCDINYLQITEFDKTTLSWVNDSDSTFVLRDENNNEVVKVEAYTQFAQKDALLNDFLNLFNK